MKKNFRKLERIVLTEIYRRLNFFHNGNLNERLLLLALPSEAKVIHEYGFIKPASNEIKGVPNWYNLTEKGKRFFSHYVNKKKLSEAQNLELFTKEYIKEFDYSLITE